MEYYSTLKKERNWFWWEIYIFYLEPQEYGKDPTECVLTLSHFQEAYFQDNTIECGSWIH